MKNKILKRWRTLWFAALIGVLTLTGLLYVNTQSVSADEAETQETEEEIRTVLKFRDGEIQIQLSAQTFMRDSMRFHKELAVLAMGLAGVAYDESRLTLGSGEYLIPAYHSLGFLDENIWLFSYPKNQLNRSEEETFTDDSLAFSIACRELGDQLLMIMDFRGSSAEEDWNYNFLGLSETIGRSFYGENNVWPGFMEFLESTKMGLKMFLDAHPQVNRADEAGKLIAFVVGHSLGGAAANLTGKLLNEGDAGLKNLDPSRIFVYTFAAPLVSLDVTQDANIHNVVNDNDVVPHLPFGRKHYGLEYHFSQGRSVYECHTMGTYASAILQDLAEPIAPAQAILQGALLDTTVKTPETKPTQAPTEGGADAGTAAPTEAVATESTETSDTKSAKDALDASSQETGSTAAAKTDRTLEEPMPDDYHNPLGWIFLIGGGVLVLVLLGAVIHAVRKR